MSSAVPSSSSRHRGRRAALTAFLAGSLIAGGTVVATTVASPAGATNAYTNLITLDTSVTTNQLVSYPQSNTGTVLRETLTPAGSSNCTAAFTGDNVLDITSAPAKVGLRDGSIGVTDKTSGEACGQANASAGESLTLTVPDTTASTAVLDLELQQDAVVLAAIGDRVGDTTPVLVELQTGRNISRNGTPITSGATAISCQVRSSSGPNSSSADNCRWVITQPFMKSIQLTAVRGNFSLEGGSDGKAASTAGVEPSGYPAAQSYLVLNRATSCATPVSTQGTGSNATVTIRNISLSTGATCVGFTYSLTTGVVANKATATFLKPWSTQSQVLQFIMDLRWPIGSTDDAELKPIEFGFHDVDLNPGPGRVLKWCPSSAFNLAPGGTQPTITQAMDVEPPRNTDSDAELEDPFPGVQYACMLPYPSVDASGPAWVQSIYVHGDAFARRP